MNDMTQADCMEVLTQYRTWNHGQKSTDLCMTGRRTKEDDIYDARRELILAATQRLKELCAGKDTD